MKERLTEEELEEEEGSNQMLPWQFHPALAKLNEKHRPDVLLQQSTGYLGGQLSRPMFHKTKWLRNCGCHPRSYMRQSQDENMTQDELTKKQKEAKDNKEKEKKQKTTPDKEPPEKATPDTTEMNTMPPLEDIDDNNDNGAKKKKFKFKKPILKPHR